jgi:toxin ParE1/3/4
MKVSESRLARLDLESIYLFGEERYGVTAARKYIHDIVAQYRLLSDWPLANAEYTDVRPPVRVRGFKGHTIIYSVRDQELEIIRVLSRFQNWRDHL